MSDSEFLKYLINEDLYLIKEGEANETAQTVSVETKNEENIVAESATVPDEKKSTPKEPIKDTLIVFDNLNSDEMVSDQKNYLEKILSAVKLKLMDVDLCHISKLTELTPNAYKQVISFTGKFNSLSTNKYELNRNPETVALWVDDLSTISGSVELRKQLWEALKQMFYV